MSLLDKLHRIPGEVGRLPSHGVGYDKDIFEENVTNGDLQVFPVSSYDEILLRTPEKLLSGEAIFEVFKRKIPWLKDPTKLYHKDVDFLMTMLRKVSNGDELNVTYNHYCGTEENPSKEHNYVVNLTEMINHTKRIDPTNINNKFELPNGQQILLGNMLFKDMLEMTQLRMKMMNDIENKDVAYEYEQAACDALARSIESVDGVSDKEQIKEWLFQIPSSYRTILNEKIEQFTSSWGITSDYNVICKDCGEQISLRPVLNPVGFFMQP